MRLEGPSFEAEDRAWTFVPHTLEEHLVDLGEVRMNFAVVGPPHLPALLLIPGQTESWWGYEDAMPLLAEHFCVFAVDLRGQGRSSWTPGRYTLDNIGNDLVRFMDLVIGRPTVVSGLSSGGVISAWLSAYAKPDQLRGAIYEDPPLFSSEVNPAFGPTLRQTGGPMFALWSKWLGDQWSIGDWAGMQAATSDELPPQLLAAREAMRSPGDPTPGVGEPPQHMKEYDPEWARAFVTGSVMAGCDHERMLANVRVPVLLTHHFRGAEEPADAPAARHVGRVRELVSQAGQPFEYRSFVKMGHAMHKEDPELFARTVVEWSATLPGTSGPDTDRS